MRKVILALLTVATFTVAAQEKPIISTAIIALNKSDLPEAKLQIDRAAEIIDGKGGSTDEKQMSKYLYHKGLIYYRISMNSDSTVKALAPNGLDVAAEYFIKSIEFEKQSGKNRFSDEAKQQLPYVINNLTNRGFEKNSAQDYEGAASDFMLVYNMRKNPALGDAASTDTNSYYYAGVSYLYAKDFEKSAKILNEVLDMGYNGYTWIGTSVTNGKELRFASKAQMEGQQKAGIITDGKRSESMRLDVYKTLLNAYQQSENTEMFKATLVKARAEYPEDGDLVKQELQGYLESKEYAKALEILEEAIKSEPDNAVLYYVKGFIYQNTEDIQDDSTAIAAYGKALEIDPENFECLYNTGAIYYAKGKSTIDEMNKLGMSSADQKKFDKLKVVKEGYFEQSIPYFEKAHKINADDLETVKALWEAYRQIGNYEKVKEMKAKMDAMTAG